jgi:hypothetical protein
MHEDKERNGQVIGTVAVESSFIQIRGASAEPMFQVQLCDDAHKENIVKPAAMMDEANTSPDREPLMHLSTAQVLSTGVLM